MSEYVVESMCQENAEGKSFLESEVAKEMS